MEYEIGIVSGYFNPVHFGHIEYINGAKEKSEQLVVIINNDYQVKLKKSKPFMDDVHRANIIHSIKGVDYALISHDKNITQCETLKYIRSLWPNAKMAFFNSGDRTAMTVNIDEKRVCEQLKIEFVLLNQPKRYSSSELLKNI
jgi:cytidyltransferase-like protein